MAALLFLRERGMGQNRMHCKNMFIGFIMI